jgi:hypothetical protein
MAYDPDREEKLRQKYMPPDPVTQSSMEFASSLLAQKDKRERNAYVKARERQKKEAGIDLALGVAGFGIDKWQGNNKNKVARLEESRIFEVTQAEHEFDETTRNTKSWLDRELKWEKTGPELGSYLEAKEIVETQTYGGPKYFRHLQGEDLVEAKDLIKQWQTKLQADHESQRIDVEAFLGTSKKEIVQDITMAYRGDQRRVAQDNIFSAALRRIRGERPVDDFLESRKGLTTEYDRLQDRATSVMRNVAEGPLPEDYDPSFQLPKTLHDVVEVGGNFIAVMSDLSTQPLEGLDVVTYKLKAYDSLQTIRQEILERAAKAEGGTKIVDGEEVPKGVADYSATIQADLHTMEKTILGTSTLEFQVARTELEKNRATIESLAKADNLREIQAVSAVITADAALLGALMDYNKIAIDVQTTWEVLEGQNPELKSSFLEKEQLAILSTPNLFEDHDDFQEAWRAYQTAEGLRGNALGDLEDSWKKEYDNDKGSARFRAVSSYYLLMNSATARAKIRSQRTLMNLAPGLGGISQQGLFANMQRWQKHIQLGFPLPDPVVPPGS